MNVIWDDIFLATPDHDEGFQRNTGEYIETYKAALQERIGSEHNFAPAEAAPQDNHGLHKEGSGVAYYGVIAPVYRPDGITALDASDIGRLWVSDNKIVHIWNGTEWIESAAVPMVGTVYLQFPKHDAPNVLYPGTTWSNISSTYAGLFFRAEGGSAGSWDALQSNQNKSHSHTGGFRERNVAGMDAYGTVARGIANCYDSGTSNRDSISATTSDDGGTEARPQNKSMRMWVRTA